MNVSAISPAVPAVLPEVKKPATTPVTAPVTSQPSAAPSDKVTLSSAHNVPDAQIGDPDHDGK
jgi:hypothetical protein